MCERETHRRYDEIARACAGRDGAEQGGGRRGAAAPSPTRARGRPIIALSIISDRK